MGTIISLRGVSKKYTIGGEVVRALDNVDVDIEEGDFVAIMGASGSGKSTLMHVIGLLDEPDGGKYILQGLDVSRRRSTELASLRNRLFGFVFQQFFLLPRVSSITNVLLPRLYSGNGGYKDKGWALQLLERVGLSNRAENRSNQLSGGQQQRVAIARALVNNPSIILADEPTGNLDSQNTELILDQLSALNEEGRTILIVTHENDVGARARRILRLRDGKITSDERSRPLPQSGSIHVDNNLTLPRRSVLAGIPSHIHEGMQSILSNKIRSFLSILGILIGVAAVIAMLALGRGAQTVIEKQLATLGSNLLVVRPGAVRVGGVALESGAATRLSLRDVEQLKRSNLPVTRVGGVVNGPVQVTAAGANWSTRIFSVEPPYEFMRRSTPQLGRFFTEEENQRRELVAILGVVVSRQLFNGTNPVGAEIRINKIPFRVIGVLPELGATAWRDQDDQVIIPLMTGMRRVLGKDYLDYIEVEGVTSDGLEDLEKDLKSFFAERHRVPPSQQNEAFEIRNLADIREALVASSRTMSVLLSVIAAISLLVGGIGIMNIMLVSVTERTREIGLRKAVGATQSDILLQFLAEAIVISVFGGIIGVAFGWTIVTVISEVAGWAASLEPDSILLSLSFAFAIGVIFGVYPARKASKLNPIVALRYD
jgi:macrolide transport system ATP-binding/permease protein